MKKKFLLLLLSIFLFLSSLKYSFLILLAFVPLLFIESLIYAENNKPKPFDFSAFTFINFLIYSTVKFLPLFEKSFFYSLLVIFSESLIYALIFGIFHYYRKRINNFYGYFLYLGLPVAVERIFFWTDTPFSEFVLGNNLHFLWYSLTGTLGGTVWILLINLLIYSLIYEILFVKKIKTVILGFVSFSIVIGIPLLAEKFVKIPQPKDNYSIQIHINQDSEDFYKTMQKIKLKGTSDFYITNANSFDLINLLKSDSLQNIYNNVLPGLTEGIIIFNTEKNKINSLKQLSEGITVVGYIGKTGSEYFSKYAKFDRYPVVGDTLFCGIILGNDKSNGQRIKNIILRYDKIAEFLVYYGKISQIQAQNIASEYFMSILILPEKKLYLPDGKILSFEQKIQVPVYKTFTYYFYAGEFVGNLMIFLTSLLLLAGITKFFVSEKYQKIIR